jgi:PEP-CTERM motif-containing protein
MSRAKRLRTLAVGVSLGLATLAASTAVMADTWQVSVINDTGQPVNDIELTLAGTGGGIMGPLVAVNPFPATFTAPPPSNELDANWGGLPLFPGQSFVADFNLTTGLTPSLIFGTWTVSGGPVGPVNPGLTTFTDIRVPEPSTMVLAGLGSLSLLGMWIRRRLAR